MRIGIPKEVHFEEKRVALAPAGVDSLVRAGHTVYIQSNAGNESHLSDEDYKKVGAQVVYSAEEVFQRSECIVKIGTLTEEEADLLIDNQIVFSFLHLAVSKPKIVNTLLEKNITAIGFELIEDTVGLPVLTNLSEMAGQLAVQVGGELLQSTHAAGRGVLLGGLTGVAPAAVVILGAGTVGFRAARTALGAGAQVIVLDRDLHKLRRIEESFDQKITTVVANPYTIARGIKFADIFIGAVLIKGEIAPHVITEEMVKTMKKGAVIIDVSIDQGGCVETSRPTSLSNPFFVKHNVIHYCVPNMTALAARTASYGITNAALPYIQTIADNGLDQALLHDAGLGNGVCTYNGYCSNEVIANTFNKEFKRLHILSKN